MGHNTLLIVIIAILPACNNSAENRSSNTSASQSTPDTTGKAKQYFPVLDFLKSEIRSVDSLPVGIRKIVINNGVKDSGYASLDEFHSYADEFISPELDPRVFPDNYRESGFYDRSTRSSTFMYEALKSELPIRRIDVQSKATDTYDKVFHLYVERIEQKGDSTIIRKMTWKPGYFLQVNESRSLRDKETLRQVKLVWNNWEQE